MKASPPAQLRAILHPYIFVLKEGKEIGDNFFDYSLMMMMINSKETIRSPANLGQLTQEKSRLKRHL